MSKNIVIFSDGTGQDGGVRPDQRLSNVYKLYRAARVDPLNAIDPGEQICFYDPGLGTDDDVHGAFGRISRTIGKLLGSVAGRGIGANIADCYEFIINHWNPGDRIYIVGFSRGAYTARCVAQVLSLCGVPTHQAGEPHVPFRRFARSTGLAAQRAVHQVYEHGAGYPRAKFEAERDEQARRFRADYGADGEDGPNAAPYFVGVFDTVAALGAKGWKYYGIVAVLAAAAMVPLTIVSIATAWLLTLSFWKTLLIVAAGSAAIVWARLKYGAMRYIDGFPNKGDRRRRHFIAWHAENYDRGLSGHVAFARHATAIDEDRADFPRVGWGSITKSRPSVAGEPPQLVQLWFAGNHSDIGGSYPETESRLSDVALEWMVEEATSLPHPLILDSFKLAVWPDSSGVQHSEVVSIRDRKLWWVPAWAPAWLRDGWTYEARKPSGSPMHPSVCSRFAQASVTLATGDAPYRPPNLADDARFRHYFDGSDPVTATMLDAASRATYDVVDDTPLSLEGPGNTARHDELAKRGWGNAVIIAATPWSCEDQDSYRDDLSFRYLRQLVARTGATLVPVTIGAAGSVHASRGLLLPNIDLARARHLAQAIGQPVVTCVDADGAVTAVSVYRD